MKLDERIRELGGFRRKPTINVKPQEIRRSTINRNSGRLLPGLIVFRLGTYQGGRK